MLKTTLQLTFFSLFFGITNSYASGVMTTEDVQNVARSDEGIADQQLSKVAGLLARYEIEAGKLVNSLKVTDVSCDKLNEQAKTLLTLSEQVIETARLRLPQCDTYLAMTLPLKDKLATISNEVLEKDYHHDGALPVAPAECYHTKDLFVHPATVLVLTRDDPSLTAETKESINLEITEVLAHTEIVRQLVIY